jgi:hypothetical protein
MTYNKVFYLKYKGKGTKALFGCADKPAEKHC